MINTASRETKLNCLKDEGLPSKITLGRYDEYSPIFFVHDVNAGSGHLQSSNGVAHHIIVRGKNALGIVDKSW